MALLLGLSSCGQVQQSPSNSAPTNAEMSLSNIQPVLSELQAAGEAGVVTVSVSASDPDNDPLSYSFSVSSGDVTASVAGTAVYDFPDAQGSYLISCTISDDHGHSIQCSTVLVVSATGSGGTSGLGVYGVQSSGGFGNAYLSWINPVDIQQLYLRSSATDYPESIFDGTYVLHGENNSNVSVTGLSDGVNYLSFFVLYDGVVQTPVHAQVTASEALSEFSGNDLETDFGQAWGSYSGAGSVSAQLSSSAGSDGGGAAMSVLLNAGSETYVGGVYAYVGQGLDPGRYFTFDVHNAGASDVTVKVTLIDDDNTDALQTDAGFAFTQDAAGLVNSNDDQFQYTLTLSRNDYGVDFRRVSIPLSSFTDANPEAGDGIFNPTYNMADNGSAGFLQLAFDFSTSAAGESGQLLIDHVAFSSEDETESDSSSGETDSSGGSGSGSGSNDGVPDDDGSGDSGGDGSDTGSDGAVADEIQSGGIVTSDSVSNWTAYDNLTVAASGSGVSLSGSGSYYIGGAVVYAGISATASMYLAFDVENTGEEDVQLAVKVYDDDDGGSSDYSSGYAYSETGDDLWVATGNIGETAFASARTLYIPLNNVAFSDESSGGNGNFDAQRDNGSNAASAGILQLAFELSKYNQSSAAIGINIGNIRIISSGEVGDLGAYTGDFLGTVSYETFSAADLRGIERHAGAALSWTNADNVDLVAVRSSTTATPSALGDGDEWQSAAAGISSLEKTGISDGSTYYVTVFSLNSNSDILGTSSLQITPRQVIDDFGSATLAAGWSVWGSASSGSTDACGNESKAAYSPTLVARDDGYALPGPKDR